ncbi:MAG TPA: acetolactate decarboxylase [Solirubrobacterales bacterium]|nr:acetolactate decarboxylase [Solirubrobacterales bacterium]
MALDEQLIGALHVSSGARGDRPEAAHRAFQTSTLTAMLDGAYEGEITFAELSGRGDLGIGTLNGCDGEMIALDGVFLRADADGAVTEVPPQARTPFAVLTRFEPRHRLTLDPAGADGGDFDSITAAIDRRVGAPDIVHAVRVDGAFDLVHCRSVAKQEPPYRPLAEVLAGQNEFSFERVEGTMAGFRFPNLGLGVGVPGYHLHFVTAERDRGGHVLGCRWGGGGRSLECAVDDLADLHVETPPGVEIAGRRLEQGDIDALERDGDARAD